MEDDFDFHFKKALVETLDMAVDSLLEIIEFDKGIDNTFSKKLSKEQANELLFWFDDEVIPLYTELEMFEKVEKVKEIRNTIKENNENIH